MELVRRLRKYPLAQGDDFIRRVLTLAIPMIFQQMLTSAVNLLDNLMVGQLGDVTLSAVAAGNKFNMIGFFAIFGVTAASGVYISQFHGAGEKGRIQESFRFSLLASTLIASLFVVLGIAFPREIAHFFAPEPALGDVLETYLPLAVLSFLPQIYSLNAQTAMRTLGRTTPPLFLSMLAVVGNACFNHIFIFGHLGLPAMGAKGAALGTLLARLLEFVATYAVVRRFHFDFYSPLSRIFQIPSVLAKAISLKALPLVINEIGFASSMALLFKFYATRGTEVMAAMTIMTTTSELFFVLFSGLSVATTVVVGHALGANKLEEARANAYRLFQLALLLSISFASLMFLSSYIVPNFYDVSPQVKAMAGFFLRIYSVFYVFYTINGMGYQIMRSGGDMRTTMIMDSGFAWCVNLPVVGLAAYLTDWPIQVIFLLGQFTDILKGFVTAHLLPKETWVRNLSAEVDAEDPYMEELLERG